MDAFLQDLQEGSYSRDMEVSFGDCGPGGEMKLSAMLRHAAEFAGFDYDARGLTYERLYERREVFLLSRLRLQVHRCPRLRERLRITTWENGVKGAQMQRVYRFDGSGGETAVSIKSDWILVDPVSRKILRPGSFTARAISCCPVEIQCPEPTKLRLPAGAAPLGSRLIRWSDLDHNGHLFSGVYGDILWDALPGDLQNRPFHGFSINYQHEALLGETLSLSGLSTEDGFLVEGRGEAGPCFTASIQF